MPPISFIILVSIVTVAVVAIIFGGLAMYIHKHRISRGWKGLW